MKQSKDAGIKAHHIQTQLLSTEAAGEHLSVDVLLVHAQDHLMCSMLAQELVQELICLYERTAARTPNGVRRLSNQSMRRESLMKILLVCAAGLSTSILMKKLEKYAEQNGIELDIDAVGIGEYQETCADYDVLLLGPQVSYQLNTVKQGSGKPTAVIPAQDYGMGNAANVLALAQSLLG